MLPSAVLLFAATAAHFTLDENGDIRGISAEQKHYAARWTRRAGEFKAGDDRYIARIVDALHLTLMLADAPWMVPPMHLQRARLGDDTAVAATWPEL